MTLKSGQTYKAWLVWGVWPSKDQRQASKAHGARTYNEGINWEIIAPPGADAGKITRPIAVIIAGALTAVSLF